MKGKLKFFFSTAVLFLTFFLVFIFRNNNLKKPALNTVETVFLEREKISAKIGASPIFIEKAVTEEQRMIGLSFRETLPQDAGLLFVFDIEDFYGFWMKDMKFP